ncbi:MAG: preprotein translocase subunit SecG [Odoribacter sp.]|nr:preprotein translocase subunit SecG [Bacteroidales bacterium]MBR2981034.1 preprotein translocase subunit SecG [Odoribacter sp.]
MVVFYVLIGLACLLLILIVLVQNPKGGGLSSTFAGSNQILGVKKTNDFLEKATWTLAIAVGVFCVLSSMGIESNDEMNRSDLENRIMNEVPVQSEELPVTAPEGTTVEVETTAEEVAE